MQCLKCNAENPVSRKFCRECGEKLQLICPHCKAENVPGDKFCGECGHKFEISNGLPPVDYNKPNSYTPKHLADKILTNRSAIEGERKLVTVLFADVANYTAMAEKLDPEEVHQIMDGAFKIIMDQIHGLGGTVNQFTGDGVMALFGAPASLEDHAQRACKAALAIQSDLIGYSEIIDREFQMRIGLNSGYVVVGSIGDDLRMDYTAVGDTTNLAARIQQAANPGEVWNSEDTHHIVQGYFDENPLGEIALKGKADLQKVYRLIGERADIRTRFEAGLKRGITELVGRKSEMSALSSAFERTVKGNAQVVDISGQAGVGKSRLVHEFKQKLKDKTLFLTGVCIEYGRNINYLPLIDIVRTVLTISRDASEDEAKEAISDVANQDLAEMVPFFQSLLSLKVDEPEFAMIEPEGRKFGTFEAVKKLLFVFSAKTSLVIFIEDVHWIDKISEEFFTYLTRHSIDQPIMIIANYRPEYISPWSHLQQYRKIVLSTLSSESSSKIVSNMLGGVTIERSLEEKIVEKTGGNPFFVEETIKELIDRGDIVKKADRYVTKQSIHNLTIPNTVQGVLAARMDRLTEDLKQTMQIASVIGRDFAFRILKRIMVLEKELGERLTKLVGFEIIYEKALYPELEYMFTHALTQEVAYESLLLKRRKEFHKLIARTIEALYSNQLKKYFELLAHHYEKSDNYNKAVEYLLLAGEKSLLNGSNQAAQEFFRKAQNIISGKKIEVDCETQFKIHFSLGMIRHYAGDYDEPMSELRLAQDICRRNNMPENEKECLFSQALILLPAPYTDKINNAYEELINRAKELNDKGLEGALYGCSGIRVATGGEPHKGYEAILDAIKLTDVSDNLYYQIATQVYKSAIGRYVGKPRETVELSEGVGNILRQFGAFGPYFYTLLFRGIAQAEIGNIEKGMITLKQAIKVAEDYQIYVRLGALYNSLGYCYNEIYQPDKAIPYNEKGIEIAKSLMHKFPVGILQYAEMWVQGQVNLIENYIDQNQLSKAENLVKMISKITDSEDYSYFRHQWKTRLDYNWAQILIHQGKIDKAAKLVQDNLEFTRKRQMKKREGSFWHLFGKILMLHGDLDRSVEILQKSISILEKVGNPRLLWETHYTLASAYSKRDRKSESTDVWGAAKSWINFVGDGLSELELKKVFFKSHQVKAILSKTAL